MTFYPIGSRHCAKVVYHEVEKQSVTVASWGVVPETSVLLALSGILGARYAEGLRVILLDHYGFQLFSLHRK